MDNLNNKNTFGIISKKEEKKDEKLFNDLCMFGIRNNDDNSNIKILRQDEI